MAYIIPYFYESIKYTLKTFVKFSKEWLNKKLEINFELGVLNI